MQRKEKLILIFTISIVLFAFMTGGLYNLHIWMSPSAIFVGNTIEGLEYVWKGGIPQLEIEFDITLSIIITALAIVAWVSVPIGTFLITKRISWKRRIVYMYFIITSYSIISGTLTFSVINFFV